MAELLSTVPQQPYCHLVLAHGAGAPMTSPFLEHMAHLLADRGVGVHRFEFEYMAGRRGGGSRRPPPKAESLVAEYVAAVEAARRDPAHGAPIVIGGKSMGGRVASMIADDLYRRGQIAGLAVLGYPFHPPGKPAQLRTAHLAELQCPTIIVQGERDPFGTRDEVVDYALSAAIQLAWIAGGDHDLKPARGMGGGHAAAMVSAANTIADFCRARAAPTRSINKKT